MEPPKLDSRAANTAIKESLLWIKVQDKSIFRFRGGDTTMIVAKFLLRDAIKLPALQVFKWVLNP